MKLEELEKVAGEMDIWTLVFVCCHHNLAMDKRKRMNGWMDG